VPRKKKKKKNKKIKDDYETTNDLPRFGTASISTEPLLQSRPLKFLALVWPHAQGSLGASSNPSTCPCATDYGSIHPRSDVISSSSSAHYRCGVLFVLLKTSPTREIGLARIDMQLSPMVQLYGNMRQSSGSQIPHRRMSSAEWRRRAALPKVASGTLEFTARHWSASESHATNGYNLCGLGLPAPSRCTVRLSYAYAERPIPQNKQSSVKFRNHYSNFNCPTT